MVEKGEKELFPSLAVAGLAGSAGPAREVLDGPVNLGRLVDAKLAEAVVDGLEWSSRPRTMP